jgi:hypothetical protein
MSGQDSWQDDFESHSAGRPPGRPEQKGMSTGMKVLIGLLVAGGVCGVLCCGGMYFMAKQSFDVDESPEAAAAAATEIAPDLKVPDTFEPKVRMKMKVPFTDYGMTMAAFERQGGEANGMMMLMHLNVPEADANDVERQFEQQMRQQQAGGNTGRRDIDVEEVTHRVYEIDGREVTFNFGKGDDGQGNQWRQVNGIFPSGKGGFTMLMVQVAESEWNEEEIQRMLASLGEEVEQPEDESAPQDEPSPEDPAEVDPAAPAAENGTRESVPAPDTPAAADSADSSDSFPAPEN